MMKRKIKFSLVDVVLLGMVLFWGGNLTIIKVALKNFHPVVFNCFRFIIASSAMVFLYRDVFRDRLPRKQLFQLFILGVLGNTVYQFMFIYGIRLTFVSHVAIFLGTTPVFTAAISRILRLEHVKGHVWFGIVLSLIGVVLIVVGSGNFDPGSLGIYVGDLFILTASLIWSFYTSFSQKVVSEYSSRHYVLYTVLFGTCLLIPISLPSFARQNWSILTLYDWGALFYSALLALVFGYSAWYYGVQKIGSTRTSIYANLTPVAGLLVGMIFLGERLSLLQWLGAIVIFLGLMLNRMTQGSVLEPEMNPGIMKSQ